MAFQFAFQLPGPVSLNSFSSPSEGIVTVDLGDDMDMGLSYSLWVALMPKLAYFPEAMEMAFWISSYSPAYGGHLKYWHGDQTKPFIEEQWQRKMIVDMIATASHMLVTTQKPDRIFLQTMAVLPERGYAKYERVMTTLVPSGYQWQELEPYHGRRAWLGNKTTPTQLP